MTSATDTRDQDTDTSAEESTPGTPESTIPNSKAADSKAADSKPADSTAADTKTAGVARGDDLADGGVKEFLNPRRHPVIAGISALCVAALVATVVLAVLLAGRSGELNEERDLNQDKATAERIAGDYAVGAATFGYDGLGTWATALKKGTSAQLTSRFDTAVSALTPLIQETQWKQTATLLAAKTTDIRGGQMVVQVFVSTHMTSTQVPGGLNTVTPYSITFERGGDWLITDVAGIAGAPQDGSPGTGQPNLVPTDTTSAPQQAPTSTPAPVP